MASGEKNEKRRLVGSVEEKKDLNRKAILWVFIITGILSAILWWQGQRDKGLSFDAKLVSPIKESFGAKATIMPTVAKKNYSTIVNNLKQLTATTSGSYAVWVKEINTSNAYGFNEQEVMDGASILKVPALLTVWGEIERGELTASDTATLVEADRSPGSGPLQYQPAGSKHTWEKILTYLGKNSDNTAWRLINRVIGKIEIEKEIATLGMSQTIYKEAVYTTTALDVAKMFEFVYAKPEIFKYLTDSIYEDRISKGVPNATEVIHKVGTLEDVWADAGIVRCATGTSGCKVKPFILVILNKGVRRTEAEGIVPEIARRVWEFESEQTAGR